MSDLREALTNERNRAHDAQEHEYERGIEWAYGAVMRAELASPAAPRPEGLDALLIEWVRAEAAYWQHVDDIAKIHASTRSVDWPEPDFGPFERWKAAQQAAHQAVARLAAAESSMIVHDDGTADVVERPGALLTDRKSVV